MSVEQDFEIQHTARAEQQAREQVSIEQVLEQLRTEYGYADRPEDLAEIADTLERSGTSQVEDHDFIISRNLEGGYALHDKRQAAA